MIQAVAFDIDDTLVDHTGAQRVAVKQLYDSLKDHFQCQSLDEFVHFWQKETERYMDMYLAGQLTFSEQRIRRVQSVFARYGQHLSEEEASEVFIQYLTSYESSWSVYDDVVSCLSALEGYRLGIISNGDSQQQREKLFRTGIRQFFSSVVVSGDNGVSKPDHAIFEQLANDLQLAPARIVYIGDNLEYDAIGAIQAGLHGIWLNRNGASSTRDNIVSVRGLNEIPRTIAQMESAFV